MVMPAQAGIQKALRSLGSRLCGNDDCVVIQSIPKSVEVQASAWPAGGFSSRLAPAAGW